MMPGSPIEEDVHVPRAPRGDEPDGRTAASAETKDRLIEAARSCLLAEGIAGASARAIGRHGDLNQALVFYHYGSVEGLLAATARRDASDRAALYADKLADVSNLAQLVAVGREIHAVELAHGSTAVLAQLLAGSVASPELRASLHEGMRPWTDLVEAALARVLAGTPLATTVPLDDIAFAIASLFLGMELMAGLAAGDDDDPVDRLFASLDGVAAFLDALLPRG